MKQLANKANLIPVIAKADCLPLAICGANVLVERGGKLVRGRQYPWGLVEVENPDHCDFGYLRELLTTFMADLQEITNTTTFLPFS